MTETVHYVVSMPRPHSHLFEVEAHFPATGELLSATLPVWTPGSYLVREYARHLQDVTAERDGRAIPVTRPDKRTFQVESGGKPVTLRYRVYANELTVRTSHLDGTHGYFNGATLFLYTEETRSLPHRVKVVAPEGWTPFCSLPGPDAETFTALNYDELLDSPFEVGPHTPLTFTAHGVPHQVVVWGEPRPDPERLGADLKRVCETEARLFRGLPLTKYVFFIYLTDKGRGGLEHKSCSALLFPRFGFNSTKGWEDFLTLAAHEYFHLWNVKRIKPRAFVPFDYAKENYTQLLWAFEGVTSYYDTLLVRRAGLMPPSRYLTRLGESLTALEATPGRRTQTLVDASLAAWIKHYRPDENSINSAISYYLKGEVVALLLDLHIRKATADVKSLDDVMRLLWSRYGDEKGVPEDGVEAAAAEVAGTSLAPFFDRSLRSTDELDYRIFSHVGLQVKARIRESGSDKGGSPARVSPSEVKPKGWLGVALKGSAAVAHVLEGSPAMSAGVYSEDELVALDGYRVDGLTLLSRCEEKNPGERVRLTLFRRERLMELEVTLGSKPSDALYLSRVENPTAAQKAAFLSWVGAAWEECS